MAHILSIYEKWSLAIKTFSQIWETYSRYMGKCIPKFTRATYIQQGKFCVDQPLELTQKF